MLLVAANVVHRRELLLKAVKDINESEEVVRAGHLREVNCLASEDWATFGNWLIENSAKKLRIADLNKYINSLRMTRVLRWHVFGSPENRIPQEKSMPPFLFTRNPRMFLPTETEATIEWLRRQVKSHTDMTSAKWGGKVWARLKKSGEAPSWNLLKTTKFWTDHLTYSHVWKLLKGQGTKGKTGTVATTSDGTIKSLTLTIGEGLDKLLLLGGIAEVTKMRRGDVLWIEMTHDRIALVQELLDADPSVSVAALGDPSIMTELEEKLRSNPITANLSTAHINLYVPTDEGLGCRQAKELDKTIRITMISPKPLADHHPYVIMQTSWRPSLIAHVLNVLGHDVRMALPRYAILTFVPHPKRSLEDTLTKTGTLMGAFKSWLLNVVPQDLLLDENTMRATIQAAMDVTLAKPVIAILTKEMRLLARGEAMTTHTVSVLTAQEKQELKKMEQEEIQEETKEDDPVAQPPPPPAGAMLTAAQRRSLAAKKGAATRATAAAKGPSIADKKLRDKRAREEAELQEAELLATPATLRFNQPGGDSGGSSGASRPSTPNPEMPKPPRKKRAGLAPPAAPTDPELELNLSKLPML